MSFLFTWLRGRVQILLQERQGTNKVCSSGWVEKLLRHKLTRRTTELEQTRREVELARV